MGGFGLGPIYTPKEDEYDPIGAATQLSLYLTNPANSPQLGQKAADQAAATKTNPANPGDKPNPDQFGYSDQYAQGYQAVFPTDRGLHAESAQGGISPENSGSSAPYVYKNDWPMSQDEMSSVMPQSANPIHAIRMPSGKIVFTNDPGVGGEGLSNADAGREVRNQTRALMASQPQQSALESDPTGTNLTMRALVQSAMRATAAGDAAAGPSNTYQVEGMAPDMSPGAPSGGNPNSGATDITANRYAKGGPQLEDAIAAYRLAQVGSETRAANMTPEQKAQSAMASDPKIMEMRARAAMYRPHLDDIDQRERNEKMAVMDPRSGHYIADQATRDVAIAAIHNAAMDERKPYLARILAESGETIPAELAR